MFKQTPQKRELFQRVLTPVVLGVLSVASILYAGFALFPQTAAAITSNTINFQARLEGPGGSIAPDGMYNIEFNIYATSSGGVSLWNEVYYDSNGLAAGNDNRVQVVNGYVSVSLGSQTAFPSTINWNQNLYLTMNVGGTTQSSTPSYDGEMNPRLALTAVPYAFQAGQLAQFNNATNFTSNLTLAAPTGGNQTFVVQDQGAAGVYTLCVQGGSSCGSGSGTDASYIQNQNVSPQTANFNISGSGTLGGLLTANAGLTVASGPAFINSSSTINTAITIANLVAGGAIGTAAATVDVATTIAITQTTAGQTLTIPAPTITTAGRLLYISNTGTVSFTVGGVNTILVPNSTTTLVWNGTQWTSAGVDSSGANYIQNTTTQQTANFNIMSNSASSVAAIISGATSQSADILRIIGGGQFRTTITSAGQFQIAPNAGGGTGTVAMAVTANGTQPALTVSNVGSGLKATSSGNNTNSAVEGVGTAGATAVLGGSTTGIGVRGTSTSGLALSASSNSSNSAFFQSGTATNTAATTVSRANGAQTGDLLQLQANNGEVLTRYDANGNYTGNGTTITLSALAPVTGLSATPAGTSFYYKVSALNAQGESGVTTEVSSGAGATVSWTAAAGATSYRVYRGTTPGGQNVYITVPGNATSLGNADTTATSGSGSAPGNAASGYTLFRSVSAAQTVTMSGNNTTIASTSTVGNFSTALTVTSAGGGYAVYGYNTGGMGFGQSGGQAGVFGESINGGRGVVGQAVGTGSIGVLGHAAGNSGMFVTRTSGNANTTLVSRAGPQQTGNLLDLQAANGEVFSKFSASGALTSYGTTTNLLGLNTPVITLSSGTAGTAFYYVVTATNAAGETVASNTIGATTNTVTISWTQIPGATGYKIYRNTTSSFATGTLLAATITNGTTTSYTGTAGATGAGVPPATTTGTKLAVQGWSGQSGNVFELINSAGTVVSSFNTAGGLTASSITLQNSTNANTVTLASSATSASYTLTLPMAIGSAGQCLSIVSVVSGNAQLGYSNCSGGGGAIRRTTLVPHYTGAITRADGSDNSGTMSTNYDAANVHSYYNWTSTAGTLNDNEVVVRSAIPSDYMSNFGSFKIWTYGTSNLPADNDIIITIKDAAGTTCTNAVSLLPGTANTWTQQTVTLSGCTYAVNDLITAVIRMASRSNSNVRIGEITYEYTN
ncbi:MAG TPA: hypothetical protein VF575_00165 [Candidatus Saccharimonadales bacterium]|jgi:hypothetical protein